MKLVPKRFNKKPKKKNKSDASAEKQGLFSLEQRIVFDAAAPTAITEFSEASAAQPDHIAPDADPVSDFVAALNEPDLVETGDSKNEVIFIDAAVEDAKAFVATIDARAEVILLDPEGDGVLQIADFLSTRSQVDAVHIISGGSESTLELGTAKLDPNDLTTSHEAALTVIDNVLGDKASIQFYGSEFGAGEKGAAAIEALSDVTGAEISRSVQTASNEVKAASDVEVKAASDVGIVAAEPLAAPESASKSIDFVDLKVASVDDVGLATGPQPAAVLIDEPINGLEAPAAAALSAPATTIAEDTSHALTTADIGVSNDWTEVAVTSLSIPSGASLTLDGVAVSLNDTITRAQIDAGDLVFTPAPNANGTDYASIGFDASVPTSSVDIMAGDASYWTLNGGGLAPVNARIADTDLFGPTGTVPTSINVIDSSTTIDAAYLAQGDIYFDGYVPQGNLSAAELTAIDTWVEAGGIMISTNDSAAYDAVSNHFGLPIGGTASSTWAIADDANSIIDGPFGSVGSTGDTFQAAGTISYFDSAGLQPGDLVISHENGYPDRPTIVLREHGDGWILFMSDEGPLRADTSAGSGMTTPNDFLSGNIFAWAIEQSEQPTVSTNVLFDVTPVNDAPVAEDDSFKVIEDQVTTFNPLLNDKDIESDVYLTEFTQPEHGNIELTVGETGALQVNSDGVTVEFKGTYTNPVVFVFTTSENHDAELPDIARVTKVTGNSFDLAIVEPNSGNPLDKTDGEHDYESVSYMVLESGTWTLADGTVVEVGTREISSNAEELSPVEFDHEFDSDPAVLSQVQTDNTGVKYNEARQDKVTTTGYGVTNEPSDYQSRVDFTGTPESIGYLAIETGTGTWNGLKFEAGTTKTNIDHKVRLLEFTDDLGSDVNFIGQLGSWRGGDNAHLDGRELDGKGIALSVQEDTTVDSDLDHTTENASWLALGGSGILTATSGTNYSIAAEDVEFVYTPADDVHGVSTSFDYKIFDADGAEDKATVTLEIVPEADTVTDEVKTLEDTSETFNVFANDNFEGPVRLIDVTGANNGTVSFDSAGNVTYTPNPDFNGTETLTYKVSEDNVGALETGTISLTIEAVADEPIIGYVFDGDNIIYAMDSDDAMPTDKISGGIVFQRDHTDHDMSLMSYAVEGEHNELLVWATSNSVSIYINGTAYSSAHEADTELHRVSFTYDSTLPGKNLQVYLDGDLIGTHDVTSGALQSGGAVVFGQEQDDVLSGLVKNEAFDGTLYSANIHEGILTASEIADNSAGNGDVISLDFSRLSTFAAEGDSGAALEVFKRADVKFPSDLVNYEASLEDNSPFELNLRASLTDLDGSEKLRTEVSAIPVGVTISDGGGNEFTSKVGETSVDVSDWKLEKITLKPVADSDEDVTLTITATSIEASNGDKASVTSEATFFIKAVADKPDLTTSNETIEQDTVIDLSDNLSGELSDDDGSESLSFQISEIPSGSVLTTSDGSGGTTTLVPVAGAITITEAKAASLKFLPPEGFYGEIRLDVVAIATESATGGQVETSTAKSDVGEIVLTITNPPPTVTTPIADRSDADATGITLDTSTAFNDPDGDTLTYSVSGLPTGLTINTTTGVISGTIDNSASQDGPFSVTVTANDGEGGTVSDTFKWTVTNPGPVAVNDSVTTSEDTPVSGDVSTNDSDIDGDDLTYTKTSDPSNGSVAFNANGTFTYTPAANFNGTDSFAYQVSDGEGGTDTETVTITVTAVNDAPTVSTPTADQTGVDDTAVSLQAGGAFSDLDSDTLTFSATGLPAGLSIDTTTGEISGTIDSSASQSGPYSVTVTADDSEGGTVSDTFTWAITNPGPSAANDTATTLEDTLLTGDVSTNDSDVDGDTLTYTKTSDPSHGSVSLNANGTFTYTPEANFNGTDTFTYQVSDGEGGTDNATVTITITAVNDAPVAGAVANQAGVDGKAITPITVSSSDIEGDTVTYSATGLPTGLTIDASTGVISGTVDNSASTNSPYTVEVTVSDGALTDTVTFSWTVDNPAPIGVDESFTTNEDTAVSGNVLTNDSDPDGDTLIVETTLVAEAAHGSVTLAADGQFTYTPDANFNGNDKFAYRLSDGEGGTHTATVHITVDAVIDAPLIGYEFDGSDIIYAKDGANEFPTEQITIDLMYQQDSSTDSRAIFSYAVPNSNNEVIVWPTEKYVALFINGTRYRITAAADTEVHRFTFTYDATLTKNNLRAFMDGELIATRNVASGELSSGGALVFGQEQDAVLTNFDSDQSFKGTLYSADIYSTVLTDQQITDNSAGNGDTVSIDFSRLNNFEVVGDPAATFQMFTRGTVTDTTTIETFNATLEDTDTITMDLRATLTDTDGSETLKTVISAIPVGVTLADGDGNSFTSQAGTTSVDVSSWTLENVFLTPVSDSDADITLSITATATETSTNDTASVSSDVTFVVAAVADKPSLTTSNETNQQGQVIDLSDNLAGTLSDTDGSESLSYKISNLPSGSILRVSDGAGGTTTLLPVAGVVTVTEAQKSTLQFLPPNGFKGTITLDVTAVATEGASGNQVGTATANSDVEQIVLTITNPPPSVATPIGDQSDADAKTVSLDTSTAFNDPDGDTLTYSASGLPTGLSINTSTGVISGTIDNSASQTGPYTVVVTADDGDGGTVSDTFTWTVTNPAPTVSVPTTDQAGVDHTVVSLDTSGAFNDVDGDTLTYSVSGLPTGLTINATTGVISGTIDNSASQSGPYSVTVVANDGEGGTVSDTFNWAITNPAPTVAAPTDDQTGVDKTVVYFDTSAAFNDVDGDSLTYSVAGLPTGLSIDAATGVISGTIDGSASQDGPYTIVVTADDGEGGAVSDTFKWTITNPAPTVSAPTADQAGVDKTAVSLDTSAAFNDADGDSLTYSVSGLPTGLSINTASGVISGTIDNSASQAGPYTVVVTANDGEGGTVSDTFKWTITNPAPTVAAPTADQTGVDDTAVSLDTSAAFNDVDADILTYSVSGLPTGLSIDTTTGVISGTIDNSASQTGTFNIVVTANDGEGGTVSDSFIWTITNPAPTVSVPTPDQTGVDNTAVSLDTSAAFNDADADTLTYSVSGLPTGLSINTSTGVISGTIDNSASQFGPYTVVVTANDGEGGTVTDTFVWTITNPAPTAAADSFTTSEDTAVTGNVLTNDSDSDGDDLTATTTLVAGPANGSVSMASDGTFTYTPNPNFNGTDNFTYQVLDGEGGFDEAVVTVIVEAVADAPLIGYELNGANILYAEDTGDAFPTDTITVDLVFQRDSAAGHMSLFSYAVPGQANEFLIYQSADGMDIWVGGHAQTLTLPSTTDVHQVTVTFDASAASDNLNIYSGGALIGTYDIPVSSITAGGSITIGQEQDGSLSNFESHQEFDGTFFSINVYDSIISQADLADGSAGAGDVVALNFSTMDNTTVTGDAASAITTFARGNVSYPSTIVPHQASVEDFNSIILDLRTSMQSANATETLTTVISAIPVGASISDGAGNSFTSVAGATSVDVSSWTLENIVLDPIANDDSDITLIVTSTAEEPSNGDTASTESEVTFLIKADADAPNLTTSNETSVQNAAIDLSDNIAGSLNDTDGSETLSYTISNIAIGSVLTVSDGAGGTTTLAPTGGEVTITEAQRATLKFTPPSGTLGTMTLYVVATATESASGDQVDDKTADSAKEQIVLTITNAVPVVTSTIADRTDADAETVSLNASTGFSDPDGGTLTFSASGLPDGLSINSSTGVISGTIDNSASQSGPYTVVVTAEDNNGGTVTDAFTWTVNNPAPTVTSAIADQSSADAVAVSLNASAAFTDVDADTLTYSIAGLPAGLSIDTNTGVISGTIDGSASQSGPYSIVVTANDGEGGTVTDTFNWVITNPAPTVTSEIPDQTGLDGAAVSLDTSAAFKDVDADTLTYSVSGLPAGLSIDASTGVISGTIDNSASQAGPYTVEVTVGDGEGGTVSDTFTWTVTNPAPTVTVPTPDQVGVDDTSVTLDTSAAFTDVDADELTYTVSGLPDGLSINASTGVISGTIDSSASQDGPYTIIVTANDGEGGTVSDTFKWTITNPAPAVTTPTADQTGVDDTAVTLDTSAAFTDVDGDELTFAATGLPAGLIMDTATGVISGTIDTSASVDGPYTVVVTATDEDGGTVSDTFVWTITNPAPIVSTPTADQTGVDDTAVSLQAGGAFNDLDLDTLTFSATGLPAGLSIDTTTGEISGTIDNSASQAGPYTIVVTADDGEGGTVSDTFTWIITNPAPTVTAPTADQAGVDDTAISLDASAAFNDIDADTLTYSVSGLPTGLSIDASTGVISGTIDNSASQAGPYTVEVTANDGEGGTVSDTFNWVITNPAPTVISATADQAGVDDTAVSLDTSAAFSDVDADTLTYSVSGLPAGLSINTSTGVISGTIDNSASQGGPYTVVVTADDGEGGTVTDTFIWTITNPAPIAVADSYTTSEDTAVTGNVLTNDSDPDADGLKANPTLVAGPANGSVSMTIDGRFTYTPNPNFNGTDSFTYQITDGQGGFDEASVTINVEAVADAPLIGYEFHGGDILYAEDTGNVFPTDTVSIEMVFQRDNTTDNMGLFSYSAGGQANEFLIYHTGPNVYAYIGGSHCHVAVPADTDIHRLTVTYDGTKTTDNVQFYLDGVHLGTESLNAGSLASGGQMVFGQEQDSHLGSFDSRQEFDGTLYSANLFDGILTQQQIETNTVGNGDVISLDFSSMNNTEVQQNASASTSAFNRGEVQYTSTYSSIITPNAPTTEDFNSIILDLQTSMQSADATETLTTVVSAIPVGVTLSDSAGNSFTSIAGTTSVDVSSWTLENIVLTPIADDDGDITLSVTATAEEHSNGDTASTTSEITFVIKAAADKPDLTTSNETIGQDTLIDLSDNLSGVLTDTDGSETLSYQISNIPNGAIVQVSDGSGGTTTLSPVAGVITLSDAQKASLQFLPPDGFYGTITLDVVAIATEGATGDQVETATANSDVGKIVLTITNPPPTVTTPIADQAGVDAGAVSLDASTAFHDPDGDTLTYSASGLPTGLSIDASTGVISGTIDNSASQTGPYTIVVTADDGDDGTVSDTFTWTITNPGPDATSDAVTTAEDTLVSGDVSTNDSDVDGDDLTWSQLTNPSNGSVSFNANGTFTYTPNADFNGTDSFTYQVSDGEGGADTATVNITVTAVNDTPVLGSVTDQAHNDGEAITPFTITSSDVDGDTLTYSAANLPTGLSIDSATGEISGTIDNSASLSSPWAVEITITDGDLTDTASFSWVVTNPAPTADGDSYTTNEDTAVSGNVLSNDADPDGDDLAVQTTLVTNPAHGSVSLATDGTFTYTPANNFHGTDTFTYRMSDGEGGFDEATVTITIDAVNDAPSVVAPIAEQAHGDAQGVSLATAQAFTDLDGDTLSYSASGLPAGLSIDATTGVISGTIDNSASLSGPYSVTVTASDGNGGTVSDTIGWTVTNPSPHVTTLIADQSNNDSQPINLPIAGSFADPDSDTLTYSATGLPPGLVIDAATGVISGTTAGNASQGGPAGDGIYTITIEADDGEGGVTSDTFRWTLSNVPPETSTPLPDVSYDDAQSLSINAANAFTSPDNDTLTFTATGLPDSLSIDQTTGIISGTLDNSDSLSSAYTIEVTVSDGQGGTANDTFTLAVSNPGPTVSDPIADQTSQDADAISLSTADAFSDIDGDDLAFAAAGLPAGLSIDPATGVISGTIDNSASQTGPYAITVSVDDGEGGTASDTFTWTVVNPAPVVDAIILDRTGLDDQSITLDVSSAFSDLDADALTYSVSGLPAGLSIDPNSGIISGTIAANASLEGPASDGQYTVTVTADDGEGGTVTDTFVWTISDVAPVVVNPLPDLSHADQQALSVSTAGAFNDPDGDALTYLASGLPPGLEIHSATGVIFGTIDNSASVTGTYTVIVSVNDGTSSVADTFNWTITNPAPIVVEALANQSSVDAEIVSIDAGAAFSDPDNDALTYSASGLPAGLTIDSATGAITGTIDNSASQSGPYSVTVTADDGEGGTVTDTFTWDVSNPTPIAGHDTNATTEDNAVTGNLLINDSDPDGDALSAVTVLVQEPSNGTVFLSPSGDYTYTPNPDFNGTDAFVYTVSDGEGGTATASVEIIVTAVNDAPVVSQALENLTSQDSDPVSVNVATAFSDVEGDTLIYSATGLPAGLTLNATSGEISGTIDHGASVNAPYTVTILASDGNGGAVSTSFIWSISNPAPDAADDTVTTTEDSAVSGNLLGNDIDPDGDTLSAFTTPVTLPSHGTVSISPDGTFTYTPNLNFNGTDQFSYRITDNEGGFSEATVYVTVDADNDAPVVGVAIPDQAYFDADDVSINVSANFEDADGTPLTYAADTLPPGLSLDPATGIISGVLASDASVQGPYSIVITATDPEGLAVSDRFEIEVNNRAPVLDSPIADLSAYDATEITIDAGSSFTDVDGDILTFSASGLPAGLSIDPQTGVIRGTLESDASVNGVDSDGQYEITVTANDGQGGVFSDEFVLLADNQAPSVDFPIASQEHGDGEFAFLNVSDNFANPDIDSLTFSATGLPPGLSIDPVSGLISGTIGSDASQVSEPYQVTIQVDDGQGGLVSQTFAWTVTNPAPIVHTEISDRESYDTQPVSIDTSGFFVDPDADNLSYSASGLPAGLTFDATTGLISGIIDHSASVDGPYTITVTADDGQGGSVSDTFIWTIHNLDPTAGEQTVEMTEDGTINGSLTSLINDPDGDGLATTLHTAPSNGTVEIGADGTYVYTPDADFNGTDSFVYQADDGEGGIVTGVITLNIAAVNDAPVTTGTIFDISLEDGQPDVSISTAGIFSDVDGDTLTYSAANLPEGLTIDPNTGEISGTVDGAASQIGTYPIIITVSDGNGGEVTSEFNVTVNNVPPEAFDDTVSVDEDTSITIDVLSNVISPDGDAMNVVVASASNGTVVVNVDGTLTYTPHDDFNGEDTITYTVSDGQGGSSTATVVVSVLSVNDGPVTTGSLPQFNFTDSQSGINIDTSVIFSDTDNDPLTYTATNLPEGLSIDPQTGVITGDLGSSISADGPYTIVITADDGNGGTATSEFVVAVSNPAPVAVDDANATIEDTAVSGNVLDNDSDPDGDTLIVSTDLISEPENGIVSLDASGNYTYTPNNDFEGSDTFVYAVTDSDGTTSTATATITVTAVNDPPVVTTNVPPQSGNINDTISVSVADSFTDIDSTDLTFAAIGLPPGLTIDPETGQISGTISTAASTDTPYTVTITASDGNGGSVTTEFSWNVINRDPTVPNQNAEITEDGTLIGDGLAGAVDLDDDSLVVVTTPIVQPEHGTVTINGSGAYTYIPDPDYFGADQFTYQVIDNRGGAVNVTVFIEVASENDAPEVVSSPDGVTAEEGDTVSISVADNFTDNDGDTLTFSAEGLPPGLTIDPNTGVISGQVALNASGDGPYRITIFVDDGNGGMLTATFDFNITPSVQHNFDDSDGQGDHNELEAGSSSNIGQAFDIDYDGIVGKTVNDIKLLGSNYDIQSNHPVSQVVQEIEQLHQLLSTASAEYGNLIGDWEHSINGFSLQTEIMALDSDTPDQSIGHVLVEGFQFERVLYLQITDALPAIDIPDASRYDVTLADGSALPSWIDYSSQGLVLLHHPVGVDQITLKIDIKLTENINIAQFISVDILNSQISLLDNTDQQNQHSLINDSNPSMFAEQTEKEINSLEKDKLFKAMFE